MNSFFKVFTSVIFVFLSLSFYSQSIPCPFVNAGPDQTADCSSAQGCSNLTATFLDIRETSSYSVESIPHTLPIPYNQTGGTQVSANTDDVWSSIITLPFTFCYYGQTFTTCKIGSNGSILFGPTTSGGGHPWSFSASLTNTTGINGAGHVLGVYHDIDPSVCGTIKWYVTGTAPCRQFIVSYNQVCHFSCTTIKSTHMMVLNETTNYIDIYVSSKPTCAGWNGGNAVIGLQNIAQNGGVTAPGRNTAPDWTVTTPEGWRFKPAGNPLYTLEWFQGTTSLGTNDSITVCPATQTTYTAQYTYTQCGSSTSTVLTDDVIVTPAPGQILATITPQESTCGQANGSVSINATGGSGLLTFSNDNVNFVSTPSFSGLLAGNYTFYVQDQGGCSVSLPVQITDLSTLAATADSIPTLCNGSSDGSINVTATGGTQPYSYILGSDSPQTSSTFNNLPAGNFTITISDAQGCQVSLSQSVTEPTSIQLVEVSSTNSTCNLPNGGLEVTATGGISPYLYSINNFISSQSSGQFVNISALTYTVEVQDGNGCSNQINVVVYGDNSVFAIPGNSIPTLCNGSSDGQLSVFTFGGPAPYQFSINNAPFGVDSVFTNLTAGSYLIAVQDANGCQDTITMLVSEPTPLVANAGNPVTVCVGENITLTANASGGTAPYSFTWNGVNQNPLSYSANATQTEQLIVTDANGCTIAAQVITTVLPLPIANASVTPSTGGVPLQVTVSNQSQNSTIYDWDFGNGSTNQTFDLLNVSTTYTIDGTFIIELIASNGLCQDTWYDTITVIPVMPLEVDVPNVFTPNADGNNEGYSVWTKNAASIEAVIVNRWGNTMVVIDDLSYQWDGKTSNGSDASPGVYFIKYKVIGLDGTEFSGHTFFHLIR
jgi:gliding motility-associated-like protein